MLDHGIGIESILDEDAQVKTVERAPPLKSAM
jgi:hypothetical protein